MSVYDDYVEKLAQSEKAGQEAINLSTKQQAENIDLMRQRAVKERENAMRGAYTDYRNVTNPYGYSSESAFGRDCPVQARANPIRRMYTMRTRTR